MSATIRAGQRVPSDSDDALPLAAPRAPDLSISHPSRLPDESADVDRRSVPVVGVAPHYLIMQMRRIRRSVTRRADESDYIAFLNLQPLLNVRRVTHEVRVIMQGSPAR